MVKTTHMHLPKLNYFSYALFLIGLNIPSKYIDTISMTFIIAIDVGTTSTRAMAITPDGTVAHVEQTALTLQHPSPNWVSQCPETLWSSTHDCLKRCLDHVGANHVMAMGITNQRETSVIWQKSTGRSLGLAIGWQCRRTESQCAQLMDHAPMIRHRTGLPLDPYFSATKFNWLLNHTPQAHALLQQNDICLGTIDTWVLFQLTQGTTYATDVTNASRTQLFNINTQAFDPDLCHHFNVPMHALATVKGSHDNFGHYRHTNGIRVPITAVIGDQQAALLAQCGRTPGHIKNTYGTGLFIMANTGKNRVHHPDLLTTIAVGMNGDIDYAIEGSVFTGGSLIQWLRDQLGLIQHASESELLAASVNDNGGVQIIPALNGLGAPHWQPTARGMILGLTQATTKAHIMRAALESLALQSNDVIQCMQRVLKDTPETPLWVDGGASQNNTLMQLQANVSGMTIHRPASIEATALGAAYCAAPETLQRPPNHADIFTPEKDESHLINQWKQALHDALRHKRLV
jgi:glycerol kinase